MQPNFEKMTNKELITYILEHREKLEPLRVLYERRTPEGIPIEENIRIMEKAIQQRITQDSQH